MANNKKCWDCGLTQHISKFNLTEQNYPNAGQCKLCCATYLRKWRAKKKLPDKIKKLATSIRNIANLFENTKRLLDESKRLDKLADVIKGKQI